MADAKSERLELFRIGAQPVKNSGRGRVKGDGILYVNDEDTDSAFFTVDVKEYVKSYGVSLSTWRKIETDAKKNLTEPMLKIVLGENQEVRAVCMSERAFMHIWSVYQQAMNNQEVQFNARQ